MNTLRRALSVLIVVVSVVLVSSVWAEQEIVRPDVDKRPFTLTVERDMDASASDIYDAWTTEKFSLWFAAPGTVLMKPEVNTVYFFESRFDGQRHPHYGRFLVLEEDRRIEMTWLTALGTQGVETLLTLELTPIESGTHIKLQHTGFPDDESRKGHEEAWPDALDELEKALSTE